MRIFTSNMNSALFMLKVTVSQVIFRKTLSYLKEKFSRNNKFSITNPRAAPKQSFSRFSISPSTKVKQRKERDEHKVTELRKNHIGLKI